MGPDKTEDGKFVRPFLSDREYKFMVSKMLADEAEAVPNGLRELYLVPWVSPRALDEELRSLEEGVVQDMLSEELSERGEAVMDVSLLVLSAIAIYYCLRKRSKGVDDYRERLVRVGGD